jgi:hypothetical protein
MGIGGECVRNCAILSICEGRPGSLVIQYFSFLVQFGVAILTAVSPPAPAPSLLYDCVRDMETTLSAFGRRPWLCPLRWRDFEVCDPARGICGASWLNDVEFSISPPKLLGVETGYPTGREALSLLLRLMDNWCCGNY